MDAILDSIDSRTVVLVAAIAVVVLAIRLLSGALKSDLGMLLTIGAIFLVLQYGFEISPRDLLYEIGHLPQTLARSLRGWG